MQKCNSPGITEPMKPTLRLNDLPIFLAPVVEAFSFGKTLKEKRLALSAIPKKPMSKQPITSTLLL
jgi:hypothetical protein